MDIGVVILLIIFISSPIFLSLWLKEKKKNKTKTEEYNNEIFVLKNEIKTISEEASKNNKRASTLAEELENKSFELATLTDKSEPLWKYQNLHSAVTDAEEKINNADKIANDTINNAKNKSSRIIAEAQQRADLTISNAGSEAIAITKEARESRLKAKERLDNANEKANEIISNAHDNATLLIQAAEDRAKDIAGSAYEAKENAEKYINAARAMKNKIDGYGDEWIIPNRSVLDELAESYQFTDVGKELKKARELTDNLIRTHKAASCDYVEPVRRNAAIQFVIDAFNGKVDTALAKVKHNNYGKLAQEIKDSFDSVNFNGSAFRSARITDMFLQARLNELKWAVAVNEIMIEEREEQRRIKEQLREEERARKEYEKAIKEAEKEEKTIKQAIEKATREMLNASEEKRLALEQRLAELQQKYEEAEAKNQRAISMAQQTRSGHVYVISNIGSFGDDVFKIGMTRRLEPLDRVRELGDASVPFSFDVHAMIYSDDAPSLENQLHKVFNENQVNKVNSRKEFFNVSLRDIKSTIEDMNINAQWTISAEAREYRESLAIAQEQEAIANQKNEEELIVA